jgi:transposase
MRIGRFEDFWQVVNPIFDRKINIGRPAKHPLKEILRAICWMEDTGAQWRNLPKEFPPKSTVHGWHKKWSREGVYEEVAKALAETAYENGDISLVTTFMDGTFIRVKGSTDLVGKTKCGKGSKIMVLVDEKGFPLSIHLDTAQTHESKLAKQTIEVGFLDVLPKTIVADKAYDSDPLDKSLAEMNVELVAPHRKNRKKAKTQDDEKLKAVYPKRWIVENFNARFQWSRRVLVRYEKKAINYLGFALLSTIGVMGQILGYF